MEALRPPRMPETSVRSRPAGTVGSPGAREPPHSNEDGVAMKFRNIALAAALLFGGAAAAAENAKPVVIKDVARFLDYQRDLRDDLGSRKFRHIRANDRKELLEAQDTIFALLQGKRSIDELSHDEQIELYNAQ